MSAVSLLHIVAQKHLRNVFGLVAISWEPDTLFAVCYDAPITLLLQITPVTK